MPTPESAAFLAKKPTVAPTFEGVDYDDNVAFKAAQDAIIREQWVRSMMARLVREEMGKCYRREGVNHLEKCGHLRGRLRLIDSVISNTGDCIWKRCRWRNQLRESHEVKPEGGCLWTVPRITANSLSERYFELLKDAKVKGYLFAQTHYIEKQ